MRLSRQLPLALAAVALGACAALGTGGAPERSAQLRLDRGLAALDAGRYAAAFDDLAWVYSHCPERQAGIHALEALAALELDPRNPAARPDIGTELLGRLIRSPRTRPARSLAETTFLTSLALGAPHPDSAGSRTGSPEAVEADSIRPEASVPSGTEAVGRALPLVPQDDARAYGCGPETTPPDTTQPLPQLPGPSMARLLVAAEAARDSAAMRVDSLTTVLSAMQEQLTATRAELERIRKVLKP
jgi:hypothetical protein